MTQRQESFSQSRGVADWSRHRTGENREDFGKRFGDRFGDRVVLITGAGSGIGAATARRFAAEGASVVLAGRRRAMLDTVARDLPPDRVLVVETDVANCDAVQTLLDVCLACFDRLDVLVNNAGIQIPGSMLDSGVDNWRRVAAANLDGVINCSTLALPLLIEQRGCIVNNASVSGLGGDWGAAHYCAAKGAVVNLTRAMALDHGAQGVRVNAVCPSLVLTPMTQKFTEDAKAAFYRRIPLGRHGEPDEVAAAIAFLASDDASFINGVNLPIDGGVSASNGQPRLPADAF